MPMTWENYLDEVKENAENAINENLEYYIEKEKLYEEIQEDLYVDDSVTGNGSGSYTMNRIVAMDNVAELIWDDEIIYKFADYGYDNILMGKGPEAVDVILRCLALDELWFDLEEYYKNQVRKNEDLLAIQYLIDNTNLKRDSAKYMIDWWSDDPLIWAETYAPNLYEMSYNEATEEWKTELNKNDIVIEDIGINATAIIVCETPVYWSLNTASVDNSYFNYILKTN